MLRRSMTVLALAMSGAVAVGQLTDPPAGAPANAPATAAATKPAAVPANQDTPRGAFKTLLEAQDAGDGKALKATISTTNPTEERIVDAMVKSVEANETLRSAAGKAFGDAAVGRRTPGSPAQQRWDQQMTQIDAAKETITGDTATVDILPNQAPPLPLKKVNGKWTIPLAQVAPPIDEKQLEQNLKDLDEQVRIVTEVAQDTGAGKYKTLEEMNQSLQDRVSKAMEARQQAATRPAASGPAGQPPTAPGAQPRAEQGGAAATPAPAK